MNKKLRTGTYKRIAGILLVGLLSAMLAGCGTNEKTPVIGASVSAAPTNGASEAGSFSESDIAITINNKTYHCGDDVSALLDQLGDKYKYSEAISCAYDGLDKTYTYDNYDIYTYPDGKVDRVSEITVYGGDVSTPKGLKVGDTITRMEELYGKSYTAEGITYVYEIPPKKENDDGASLYVTVDNDKIKSIAITAETPAE